MYRYAIEDVHGKYSEETIKDKDIMEHYEDYSFLLLANAENGEVYVLDLSNGRFFMYSDTEVLKDITPVQVENYLDLAPYEITRCSRAIVKDNTLVHTGRTLGYRKRVGDKMVIISLVCWDNSEKENEFEINLRDIKWQTESSSQTE